MDSSTITAPPITGSRPSRPASRYWAGKRSAEAATTMMKAASASRLSWVMYGARSLVPSGAHSFWMIWPPASSKLRWKPPTTS